MGKDRPSLAIVGAGIGDLAVAATLRRYGMGAVRAQQAWPSQPIRFVVAFGPGGVGDTTARQVAEKLGEKLGQPVVVENNPGGGGIAAARAVISAPADGHTRWRSSPPSASACSRACRSTRSLTSPR
jgi:tripartite-type tricarboxylate transporter receptor subunit TctC